VLGIALVSCSPSTAASQDPARPLWGVWNAAGTCPDGGQEGVQMLLNPDGSYAQLTTCGGVNGPATYALRITGNYRINASSSQLELTNLQSDPAKDVNGNPYLHATTELDDYSLTDSNTLTISNRVCGSPCTLIYHRS
jgi:hypothetical protein